MLGPHRYVIEESVATVWMIFALGWAGLNASQTFLMVSRNCSDFTEGGCSARKVYLTKNRDQVLVLSGKRLKRTTARSAATATTTTTIRKTTPTTQ